MASQNQTVDRKISRICSNDKPCWCRLRNASCSAWASKFGLLIVAPPMVPRGLPANLATRRALHVAPPAPLAAAHGRAVQAPDAAPMIAANLRVGGGPCTPAA